MNKWEFATELSEARSATRDTFVSVYFGWIFSFLGGWLRCSSSRGTFVRRMVDVRLKPRGVGTASDRRQNGGREGGKEEKRRCRMEGRGVGGADVGRLRIVSFSIRLSHSSPPSVCLCHYLFLFSVSFLSICFFFAYLAFSLVYFCLLSFSISVSASFNLTLLPSVFLPLYSSQSLFSRLCLSPSFCLSFHLCRPLSQSFLSLYLPFAFVLLFTFLINLFLYLYLFFCLYLPFCFSVYDCSVCL